MPLNRAIKRFNIDIKEFKQSPIDGCAIFQCEDPCTRVYIAIAGPKDSAYHDGVYFFQLDITEDYPNQEPKCKFLNWQNSNKRMHPNLYVDGKVCLSILGTWKGPSWTSVMTLSTVILALQSILDDNPLKNEPGYNKDTSSDQHKTYQRIVQYYNYKDFVMKTMECTFNKDSIKPYNAYLKEFKEFLVDYYLKRNSGIQEEIVKLVSLYPEPTKLSVSYHSVSANVNYVELLKNYNATMQDFILALGN